MIWRDGNLPAGAPPFAASLTEDLFYHGYGVLAQALRLRELGGARADVEHALRVAAESRVTIQRSLAQHSGRSIDVRIAMHRIARSSYPCRSMGEQLAQAMHAQCGHSKTVR